MKQPLPNIRSKSDKLISLSDSSYNYLLYVVVGKSKSLSDYDHWQNSMFCNNKISYRDIVC